MRLAHLWFTVPLRLRSLFRRARVERELDEELQFHLERKIEEGTAGGLSPEEARYAALRAMGGVEQHKEAVRETRGVRWWTDLSDDFRYALRSLGRVTGLTGFVVMTLAVGVGMTAAGFSMMDSLIFRPYPVRDPDRIVSLVSTTHDDGFQGFSHREYLDIRGRTRSYSGVIAHGAQRAFAYTSAVGATPQVRAGMLVSGNFFRVLGVEPRIGRGFRDGEDQVPGRDAVAVLSHAFWEREFKGDPSVVGRTIRLNDREFTVIGVAPERFTGLYIFMRPDLYVPLAMTGALSRGADKDFFEDRSDRQLVLKARLAAGTSLRQAQNELALLAGEFARDYPTLNRDRGATVRTRTQVRTQADQVEWKFSIIFAMLAVAVLLVACTNVTGLLLARARARTREIAVRLALGASRFRVIRLLLSESLVLAFLGGVGGVAVGYAVIRFLGTFQIPSDLPITIPFQMDTRVLFACLGVSLTSALLCGLAPALQITRTDLVTGLKSADVDPPGPRRLWGRNALVVAQVAVSLMLIASAFLMARNFREGAMQATGFVKDHLLMARFDPRLVQLDGVQTRQFYDRLTERARALPGVVSAGLTENPPLGLDAFQRVAFAPEGFRMPGDRRSFSALADVVDAGFFETMGIRIDRGRGFLASDDLGAPRVAVINEQLASHYWPGGEAVGKRIRLDGPEGPAVEIVGVAKTIKYRDTAERPMDFLYLPLTQRPTPRMVLLLRTSGDPLGLAAPVRQLTRALHPNLPILELRTYEELYRYSTVEGPKFAVQLVGTMGMVALLLAMAGLYGLVAYNVSRRTRELGIRIAVGAGPADVLRLVMSDSLVLVGIGAVLGVALSLAIERLIDSMVFTTGRVDLLVYVTVIPCMILVTLLAAYIPARRASRIAPTQALRHE